MKFWEYGREQGESCRQGSPVFIVLRIDIILLYQALKADISLFSAHF